MVMIDLVDEKKSLGFSSVTQVTEALLAGYLPYTPLARQSRSGAIRAGRPPGPVRLADMPRTEGKYAEPGRVSATVAAVLILFECFAVRGRRLDAGGGSGGALA
jgi:hypothetical protein